MPANSWPENNSYNELDEISTLISDISQTEDSDETPNPRYGGRRRKAAIVLTIVWSGTIALHLLSWGSWLILGLTTLMGIHAIRVLRARPHALPESLSTQNQDSWPFVSLLVAAKNEEAVIESLVKTLCSLDYPSYRYELWVIDDNSTDKTPLVLKQLTEKYDRLKVFRRSPGATGGKSGALNQVLPLTRGDIIAVFDADARVPKDMLRRVVPAFAKEQVGAVQVQKAISNPDVNFLTVGQVAEMALDSFFQQQRIAVGGIGELRGNGEFIRRSALEDCGGFNEETITDDLDLTIRLHLHQWDIEFLIDPAVEEEGVTTTIALWHQRNRWAEGGYQRYLDYWRPIFAGKMGYRKTWDMFMFWITQYFLPTAAVPDFLMAIARNRLPVYSPVTVLMLTMSFIAMFSGLRRINQQKKVRHAGFVAPSSESKELSAQPVSTPNLLLTALNTLRGNLYMLHWVIIMASATARMSVLPKRLKWVKTIHQGTHAE